MKIKGKWKAFCLCTMLLLLVLIPGIARAGEDGKKLDVLFVHDIHSHLNTFTAVEDGKSTQVGGLSRIMTLAKRQFTTNPDTLFVDGGDFSMGTIVQSVFETESAELRTMGAIGIVATTFGNHEFDFGSEGLANAMNHAVASGDKVPFILVSNIDWEATYAAEQTEGRQALIEACKNYGVRDYIVVKKGDVNVAIMGIYGKDALGCSPFAELIFKDPVEAAKETVAKIQANETADIIVCLSHSGTWADAEKSEDEILAKNVPEIDLIVSGHTHTKLENPIVQGNTYIVSTGEYGKYLGSLSMEQQADGQWKMKSYQLLPVTEDIPQDEKVQDVVDGYLNMVDESYLSNYNYERTQILAENEVDFVDASTLGYMHVERNLGSIMADSYRYAIEHLPEWDGVPVTASFVPAGLVRETYGIGNVTVEDVFNSFSLGIGEDGSAGYPLVSVYLTGAELKIAAEIDASISPLMEYARLYTSGLQWTFNPKRMILNKSFDTHLVTLDGTCVELENDKLYRVATDLYSLKLLGSVTDLSYGLLSLVPKNADGTPIEDYASTIVMTDGREFKAWEAIANYMESFEDTDGDGIPNVDLRYAKEEGRKAVEESSKLGDLLKSPNKYFFMILGVVLVVLAIPVVIVVGIIKAVKRKSHNNLKEKKMKLKCKI